MAVKLLLHENTHLLANFDEQLADQIALAIYRTWLTLDLNQTPIFLTAVNLVVLKASLRAHFLVRNFLDREYQGYRSRRALLKD